MTVIDSTKIVVVIPAHLASVRFPRKILHKIHGLPMIEHVRRRALLSDSISNVYIATCDQEIADSISSFGGEVIMTKNTHKNGKTRVAEAIKGIECSHVILVQGDEPLLLPRHIDTMVKQINKSPNVNAWNATAPIENEEELDKHSFVKCSTTLENDILYCFRRSPCYSDFKTQQRFIRKILGLIAYKKEFLLKIVDLPETIIAESEFIEQMQIIESNFNLKSVPVSPSLPSVNEPNEVQVVLDYLKENMEQSDILKGLLSV